MFGVLPSGRYQHFFFILKYVVFICLVINGTVLSLLVPTSQNIIHCWFIHDVIIPNKCVRGFDVLNYLVISFPCHSRSF